MLHLLQHVHASLNTMITMWQLAWPAIIPVDNAQAIQQQHVLAVRHLLLEHTMPPPIPVYVIINIMMEEHIPVLLAIINVQHALLQVLIA